MLDRKILSLALAFLCTLSMNSHSVQGDEAAPKTIRIATYNVSLYGTKTGEIRDRLSSGDDQQAANVAAIVQTIRPDILLVNEIDHDPDAVTAKLLAEKFFAVAQEKVEGEPIEYPYVYSAPSNTGIASGMDLDGDTKTDGPGDAWGFGVYPGQYSMAVFSRFPIDESGVRTFQKLLWKDLPDALRPIDPTSKNSYYDDATWNGLRLSSKNHIDVPVQVGKHVVHVLASHPTPPVFDGPEDRNGNRNHDEIRFWSEYIENPTAEFLVDDDGVKGGLKPGESFFVAGDLNSNPIDGDSRHESIANLLKSNTLVDPQPKSPGAAEEGGGSQDQHKRRSGVAMDTADFGRNGNMRVDYVLPSKTLAVKDAGVFWPTKSDPKRKWITASDHRMVWVDVELPAAAVTSSSSSESR